MFSVRWMSENEGWKTVKSRKSISPVFGRNSLDG